MKDIVFEDNFIAAMTLRMMVEDQGYKVVGSYDSADEINHLFAENDIDLILMDISLNGKKTGIESIRKIRAFSQAPVVFLSGNNSKETLDQIESISNASFISKPFTEVDVKRALAAIK